MVQINFAQKQINAKIVYYGPGMSGKTTNLEVVHQRAPNDNRGELTSISTDGDRTLFFDYMPLDLGTVAGMRTCFQLYTVPGQVYYNSTRKLVLQGVDGVIFVADSSASMLEQNLESLRNLEENLNEYGKSLANLPLVIQYNKRDVPDAMTVEELNAKMNTSGRSTFEAIANTGQGVFPTLKALASEVLKNIMSENSGRAAATGAQQAAPAAPAAQQAPPPQVPEPQPALPQQAPAHAPQPAMAARPQQSVGTAPPPQQPMRGTQPQAPPAQHQPPAQQRAQQRAQPTRSQPTSGPRGAGSGYQAVKKTGFHSRPRVPDPKRGRSATGSSSQAAVARKKKKRTQAAPPEPAPRKGNPMYTGAFVLVALAIGALLATVVLGAL